ncbi:hypothetical protein [Choristoneura rosaceana nucleopolyhedrovirus]|uniref:Uncharacterized protein n=1 Tax=Choristoneura rosaceana nucleopolyhedrovirus TaxID=58094 RepID=S5MR29_9ABAC|nr:hypothetical protein [Choristoneura rosaceana nucleopolyhedrovirus]AGR57093.1 hypothetical protein [Choristoneura rosaceana nucleopolyhedrovirus]
MSTSLYRQTCWQYRLLKYIEPYEECWNVLFIVSQYLKNKIRQNALQNYIKVKTFDSCIRSKCSFLPNRVMLCQYYNLQEELLKFIDIYQLYYAPTVPKHNIGAIIHSKKIYNFFAMMGDYFEIVEMMLKTLKYNGERLHYTNGMMMVDLMRLFENNKLFHMHRLLQRLLLYCSPLRKTPESLLAQTARSIYRRGGRPLWQLRYMIDTMDMPFKLRVIERKWSDDCMLNEFLTHYQHQLNEFSTKFEPGRALKNYKVCLAEIRFKDQFS